MIWLPFELHPTLPPEGKNIREHLGIPAERYQMVEQQLKERAAELGLPFTHERLAYNTRRALLLTEWAREHAPDRVNALHRALFRAYFGEGRNLADDAVLRDACEEAGLPAAEALAGLEDPKYADRLDAYQQFALQHGITGVPCFIINDRYRISGAQPYDVMVEALRKIAAEA